MVTSSHMATTDGTDDCTSGQFPRFDFGLALQVHPRTSVHRLTGVGLVFKRLEDLFLATLMLFFIAPVMAFIAIAVKLDSPGPVLFWQRRRGLASKTIWVCKFRTMSVNATDEACKRQTSPDDLRVTRIGQILRKHSLDELPQLLNVIRGDMSLVGPRPHAMMTSVDGRPLASVASSYRRRYTVKPGITGWAQVNGWRGELDTPEKLLRRIQHDLYYIENWSITFDIKILVRSVACVFNDEQAF